eukprot:TRINITY_DN1525_c0_g1_i1.p3 TRINITY_DN1525_c0_g1~~TRINITY_DN1525_c0_g1_i1.p3  ORF type:complete len:122 (-),score=47.62 TRINITY_DN1525_c0_g1_i1:184-549(-)
MLRAPTNTYIARADAPFPADQFRGVDPAQEERLKLNQLQTTYGWWMPARYVLERERFAGVRRLGGLPSSFLGLETFTGSVNAVRFEDYMNDPSMDERVQPPVHEVLERQILGKSAAFDGPY